MPDLGFQLEGVEAPAFTASPLLAFKLRVTNATGEPVHAVILRCQIQIEAARRRYEPAEQERLRDLFGEPHRWRTTLRGLLWTIANVSVPAFTDPAGVLVDVQVPVTYDFEVASAKYLDALAGGEVPLTFLFSGTVFYEAEDGAVQVDQISWEKEAGFRLPLQTWQAAMDAHFPGSAWLRVRKDVFDRLYAYRRTNGLTSWDVALERLLPEVAQASPIAAGTNGAHDTVPR